MTQNEQPALTAQPVAMSPRPPLVRPWYSAISIRLLPWAAYTLVTFVLLRNLLPQIGDHVPGLRNGWQNVWNLWWMRYALLHLHTNPFYTDYLYYPTGTSLLFHTYAPLNGVLFLPLTYTLGALVTVNLVAISSFVFSAMAAYALARVIGLSQFAAWIAGAVYSFCNPARWHYFGGGQADHLAMWWMPLYILCLIKATEPDRQTGAQRRLPWKWLTGAVVFLAANGLTDWQFFVYMGVFTSCYMVYLLLRERGWVERGAAVRNVAIIVVGAAILLSPLLYASISEALSSSYMVPPIAQTEAHTWDLTTYFTPNAINPLWGGWAAAQQFSGNNYGDIPGISNSGYLPLILAIVGMLLCWRQARQWAIFGLIFAVLSLGTHLYINDVDTFGPNHIQIPLPYTLLLKIPFFNISRNPSRFSLIAFLCVGILAGYGWQAITARQWWRRPIAKYALAAIVVVVTLGEFIAVPYVTTAQPISPFYQQLGRDPEQYALLELPIADKYYTEYSEALESIHHKQLLGGVIARKPCYCFAQQTPVINWFWNLSLPANNDIIAISPNPASYAPAVLNYYNLRYIVIWKWILKPADYDKAQALVKTVLPGAKPVADDSVITAYAVAPSTTDVLPAALADDWGSLEHGSLGAVRWASPQGSTVLIVNPNRNPRLAHLTIRLQAFQQPRTLQVAVNGKQITSPLIKPELQTVTVDLTLQPGSNQVLLASPEPPLVPANLDPRSNDRRSLTFAVTHLEVK